MKITLYWVAIVGFCGVDSVVCDVDPIPLHCTALFSILHDSNTMALPCIALYTILFQYHTIKLNCTVLYIILIKYKIIDTIAWHYIVYDIIPMQYHALQYTVPYTILF